MAAVAGLAVLAVAATGCVVLANQVTGVSASLTIPASAKHVRVTDPVTIKFSREMDTVHAQLAIKPWTAINVQRMKDRLVLKPTAGRWEPNKKYSLLLGDLADLKHSVTLKGWRSTFETQPRVDITAIKAGGQTISNGGMVMPRSKVTLVFSTGMKPQSVTPTLNAEPVASGALNWSKDGSSVDVSLPALKPYTQVTLGVLPGAFSAAGDPFTGTTTPVLSVAGLVSANSSSGIGPGFKTVEAVEVVVENAGGSKPHAGLQQADIVYEYISEYSITRMTAIYFNQTPSQIGSVRSCRMINAYLAVQYSGPVMCSGMSVGTDTFMRGSATGHGVPRVVNGLDGESGHFFRVGFKAAPHNLYTDGGSAARVRSEIPLGSPAFAVDPPHPDSDAGDPADAPSVPLHGISYAYDSGSKQYLRYDHGSPESDQDTNAQIQVKNVVVMHVDYHVTGWVEDDNGGAHSIWYHMNGEGPAEIWSDGKVIHATWHAGSGNDNYWDNTRPPYFTDQQGNLVELNTGLTWIHAVGNGQTG